MFSARPREMSSVVVSSTNWMKAARPPRAAQSCPAQECGGRGSWTSSGSCATAQLFYDQLVAGWPRPRHNTSTVRPRLGKVGGSRQLGGDWPDPWRGTTGRPAAPRCFPNFSKRFDGGQRPKHPRNKPRTSAAAARRSLGPTAQLAPL